MEKNRSGGDRMTRKEALKLAVEALQEKEENGEAVRILRELVDELPIVHWTEASIRDAVEQFIQEHGCVPCVSDFRRKELPPHTVIQRRFGVTLQTWLDQNYPRRKPDKKEIRAKAAEAFTREYLRIRPRGADAFNAQRQPGTPCWQTVAALHGLRAWRPLLAELELPVFSAVAVARKKTEFRVRVIADME